MMIPEPPSYEDLQRRLARAEAVLEALRKGELDLVIGADEALVVRFQSLEEENRRLVRQWQTTFDTVQDAIVIVDADQRVVRCNRAAASLFGHAVDEMIGSPCWLVTCGSPSPTEDCPITRIRRSLQRERRQCHVGGRWLEVTADPILDAEGRLCGTVLLMSDITQRKHAEETLRASEERNRVIAELISEYAYIMKVTETGEIHGEWLTDSFTKVFGLTIEAIDAQGGWQSLVYPEDLPIALQHAQQVISGYFDTCEMRWTTKQGEIRWLRDFARPVFDATGTRVVRIYGAAQDITERRRAEAEKAKLEEQVRQMQKVEAIGRLAGGVAHDFNNMLNVILGYGEILLSALHESDPLRKYVSEIIEAGRRSAKLTQQLLAFSRKQTLQPEVVHINDVLRNLEKMLRRLIGEDIDLILSLADKTQPILVDPGQLDQVILNLAVNARDAMPSGGKLVIETADVELDEAYVRLHPGAATGKYVRMSISDTGCGMSREVMHQIFEPFFTTKEPGKGTGLGLSTVYGIVKQSGGNIWVYSEPEQGTTFKIYFPQARETTEASKIEEMVRQKTSGSGEHILIVEDEEAVRNLTAAMLEQQQFRVTLAANAGEAILLVEEKGIAPDLVLTDVVMPHMNGRQLVERLRASHPDLKALYMSGYTDNGIVHHGILDSGTPFIQKPFSAKDLTRKIHLVLGHDTI